MLLLLLGYLLLFIIVISIIIIIIAKQFTSAICSTCFPLNFNVDPLLNLFSFIHPVYNETCGLQTFAEKAQSALVFILVLDSLISGHADCR